MPNVLKTAQVERAPEGVYAKVDYDKCTKCGVCKRSCFYDAITLTKCGAVIDQHKCDWLRHVHGGLPGQRRVHDLSPEAGELMLL